MLDLLSEGTPESGLVHVVAAGIDLGTVPLQDPLSIPLPPTLPIGRTWIEILPAGDEKSPVEVIAAAVRPVLPAGEARLEGQDLLQSGNSMVEVTRPVQPGQVLHGEFVPPSAGKDQEFELWVESQDGQILSRSGWTGSWLQRWSGSQRFQLPLGDASGFVRFRFLARGSGPPARWKDLILELEVPEATKASPQTPETAPYPLPRLVVLYVMDALRADFVGHLGGPTGISPAYDRLAAAGMTFRQHRSVAPNTLPAIKALFTGETWVDRGGWALPAEGPPTLAELFRAAGYTTGLFSGNAWIGKTYGMDRGFDHVAEEVLFTGEGGGREIVNTNAREVHAAALAWLRSLPQGAKAMLYLHTIHPHNPYMPPEPVRSRWADAIPSAIDGSTATLMDVRQGRRAVSAADQEKLRALYAANFAYNDQELDRFLRALSELYPAEETLVILTSDHGEELFDHGGVLHGYTLFEEMIRIPLVVWWPNRVRPGECQQRTSILDVHATMVDLLGMSDRVPSEGRSLLSLLLGDRARGTRDQLPHFAAAASVQGGIYSAQTDRWKWIWAPRQGMSWGMGEGVGRSRDAEYLFDLLRDPGEGENLAARGDVEAAWLRHRLLAWLASKARDGAAEDTGPALDEETRKQLEALGYIR